MAEDISKAIKQLMDAGAQAAAVRTAEGATYPFVVIPNDQKVVGLESFVFNQHAPNPERKMGSIHVQQDASFIEYWSLFADQDSRAFAQPETATVIGILDYHHASAEMKARWGQHRVTLTLEKTDEWNTWKGSNGKRQSQADFAEFLEDNAPDIIDPNAATFVEAARDLKAKSEVSFSSAQSQKDGSVQFTYSETTQGKFGTANMDIPERFTIAVPIFDGMDKVQVQARLRYRINSGKLTMWYDLYRADYRERDAFNEVLNRIQHATGRHVFIGTP